MAKLNIVGAGYTGRSKNINASRSVNFYPEVNNRDDKAVVSLSGTPGTRYFTNVGSGISRGLHVFNNLMYVVVGNKLYSVDADGIQSSQLGDDLQTSVGRVQFSDNGLTPTGGNQLIISDGLKIYVYNVSSGVFETKDITSYTNCFVGGYFVADVGGGRFQVSDLYDGSTWNGINVATAEAEPDSLLSVFNNHGELWLFGEYTTEVWYQSGTTTPPFRRVSGGVIDYGCAARYSIAKGNNTIIWMGNKRNNNQGQFIGVYMAEGYNARLISPPSINYIIDNYSVIDDAFAYFYTDDGHEFYVLTFPTANATWVYDTTTGYWHERSTYKDNPYKVNRHIGNCYCHFQNKHYIGDYQTSNILEMNSGIYEDMNEPIVSFRTTNHIYDVDDLNNLFISKLQIDSETGNQQSYTHNFLLNKKNMETRTYGSYFVDGYLYSIDFTNELLLKLDQNNFNVIDSISVGSQPYLIYYLFDYLWVVNYADQTISKIDTDSFSVVATISTGLGPRQVIEGGDYIWVGNSAESSVSRINPTTNESTEISLSGSAHNPDYLLYYDNHIWVQSRNSPGIVDKINVSTGLSAGTYNYGTALGGLVVYNDYIYMLRLDVSSDNYLIKVDPSNGVVDDSVLLNDTAYAYISYGGKLRVVGSDLWILNNGTGSGVVPSAEIVDLGSMTKTASIVIGESGSYGRCIEYVFGYIWIYVNSDNKLLQIDVDNKIIIGIYNSENDCRILNNNDDHIFIPGQNTLEKIIKERSTPQALLSWSNDSGNTWSNEYSRSMGTIGEYKKRLIWNRLGSSRNKTYRITISEPIKKVLLNEYIKIRKGSN